MWFGAEARARLAVLPVCALVMPWRCGLGLPLTDRGEAVAPGVVAERREPPPPPAVVAEKRDAPSPAGDKRGAPAVSAASEKREPPAQRVSSAPPRPPPVRVVTLPEEVVLKAIGVGQRQLLHCWTKAQQVDPGLYAGKVRLHLEIDPTGRVTSVTSDTESAALARCLGGVARQLRFPAPGQAAVVDVPLMFP
jgi:hypothetical protein